MSMISPLLFALPFVFAVGAKVDFYIGTYTTGQPSKGVYRVQLDTQTGAMGEPVLAGATADPSYVALDASGRFLYAVDEGDRGKVSAFSVGADRNLTLLNTQSTHGSAPCHLVVAPGRKSLLVANYTSGNVVSLPIQADGSLGSMTGEFQNAGHGPDRSRQEGPHMHAIYVDPRSHFAYACDLGTDNVVVFPFDSSTGGADLAKPARANSP